MRLCVSQNTFQCFTTRGLEECGWGAIVPDLEETMTEIGSRKKRARIDTAATTVTAGVEHGEEGDADCDDGSDVGDDEDGGADSPSDEDADAEEEPENANDADPESADAVVKGSASPQSSSMSDTVAVPPSSPPPLS